MRLTIADDGTVAGTCISGGISHIPRRLTRKIDQERGYQMRNSALVFCCGEGDTSTIPYATTTFAPNTAVFRFAFCPRLLPPQPPAHAREEQRAR